MPGLRLIRPADANETAAALEIAVDSDGPTALVLSRQDLPVLAETERARGRGRRARRLCPRARAATTAPRTSCSSAPGARSSTASERPQLLEAEGIAARVVSFPSWDLFAAQDAGYRDERPARGRAPARRRGRRLVRLGALRGRHGRDRPLRCLGAGGGEHGEVRLHRRSRRRASPRAARRARPRTGEEHDKTAGSLRHRRARAPGSTT